METKEIEKIILAGGFSDSDPVNMGDIKIVTRVINSHAAALKEMIQEMEELKKEIKALKEAHNAN